MITGWLALRYSRYASGRRAQFVGRDWAPQRHAREFGALNGAEGCAKRGSSTWEEKCKNAAIAHLARKRGGVDIIHDELVELTRDISKQRIDGQESEFYDRARGQGATTKNPFPSYCPQISPNARRNRGRRRRSNGAGTGGTSPVDADPAYRSSPTPHSPKSEKTREDTGSG